MPVMCSFCRVTLICVIIVDILKEHSVFIDKYVRSQAWGAIVEMLVPVEFYEEKDTDKFEEYGNTETCI